MYSNADHVFNTIAVVHVKSSMSIHCHNVGNQKSDFEN